MGVTGLWTVLQPCARPIKIETLNKKRLAVDASIWIYQFLKAVRDKEGNALRNSHIVGFFRRICKLLFFGIKPVFVFDGGAPALKRQTISSRKSRREGRREDAVRTAAKLLTLQMQRAAEEEEKKRKDAARHPREEPEEDIPENVVYADEVMQTQRERNQNRKFRKKDQYHLPDLDASMAEMGQPNDPRIMSIEELEDYARTFDRGEDINVYDFSKIDFDSPFFVSLPASDRYNILNAARLRSRLRMGYSKDQLDTMFPDRMAFSRFQIDRVRERNELTQRLMNINGMADDGANMATRVASERGREYVLVKNDGVEGGWALGVVTNREEGQASKPIDVDKPIMPEVENEDWEADEDFEDVPIEGLNRLPKHMYIREGDDQDSAAKELAKRRRRFYQFRRGGSSGRKPRQEKPSNEDPDSLFLAEEPEEDEEWENVPTENNDLFETPGDDQEDQQLQQAIAMSLQKDADISAEEPEEEDEDVYREVFQQEKAKDTNPFTSANGSGLAIARLANQRSSKLAPSAPFTASDSEDDGMDLQAALAESRKSKRAVGATRPAPKPSPKRAVKPSLAPKPNPKPANAPGFDGPLPFEKLNLGNSILGKKKMQKIEADTAGGFEKDLGTDKKSEEPLPPWFSGDRDINEELTAQRANEKQDWERAREEHEEQFQFQKLPRLQKRETREVIDLEAPASQEDPKEVFTIASDEEPDVEMEEVVTVDSQIRMGDLADKVRIEPPQPLSEEQRSAPKQQPIQAVKAPFADDSDEEPIDWSESEPEEERRAAAKSTPVSETAKDIRTATSPSPEFEDVPMQIGSPSAQQPPKSPSPEFEDVPIRRNTPPRRFPIISAGELEGADDLEAPAVPLGGTANDNANFEDPADEDDQYSDPEDAELFASLAAEAEEHARFAQELTNNQTTRINFDEELKQLRAQQKKDRRDADEVTQTMISECQHLLTLFGLPYVTAPMEAEAQCAELVTLGLVDGIVTDDSDTFLFGGTRVYKNMFNAAKFVECYLANDLTSEFSLTREKLIAIAQLLGSDYTTGIPGIGPVNALEIIGEFGDLQNFKDWWTDVQNNGRPKDADKDNPFRRRFRRNQTTKLFLPTNFPDPRVAEAYLLPDVDDDPQPFQWGVPDLDALRTFLSNQIGWSRERTDEVLVPVIKDMNRREKEGTQSNITRFFEGSVGAGAFAPRVRDAGTDGPSGKKKGKAAAGKRLANALTRLAEKERSRGDGEEDVEDEGAAGDVEPAEVERKRKSTKKGTPGTASEDVDGEDEEDELYAEPKKKQRKMRKGKANS
ncbi:hypothetical protein BDV96DRAFT_501784 [Lophiotrema nucula]|uniref:PIN domain-like protein n=1 Tax=Lophiotrema nucula TaxID=690887 RepID=A0A6A5YVC3_9PLEO|nr:hypothetical protein BDV96DRAFT_501784 [Lophiotrema nucula]